MKLTWKKPKILPELVNVPLMKGHKIRPIEGIEPYFDTVFSTFVIDPSNPATFTMNSLAYSDKLEAFGWFGAADTVRSDVKRGKYGGSFEEKSYFRNPNNQTIEIALTSEYRNEPKSHGIFLFEAYKVVLAS